MKLTDYVAQFLSNIGVEQVFVVSGGASLHLIHSIAHHPKLNYVSLAHEQACAMAADGYARIKNSIGVAIATSGPGATNLLTGVCCAYYDSIPCLFLTGQVATFRFRGHTGVRQYGFQETDTVEIFKSVTKYAVLLKDPSNIRYELEKAYYIATTGRMGPVLLDIPDDLQRIEIKPQELKGYIPKSPLSRKEFFCMSEIELNRFADIIGLAKRPIFIAGAGIRAAKALEQTYRFLELTGMPVAPTWAMNDAFANSWEQKIGTFGTHGTRYGNFAVQNADLILSVGSRLDTHETGSPPSSFAREAKKIIVDIDPSELGKFSHYGIVVDELVHSDALEFLCKLNERLKLRKIRKPLEWIEQLNQWRNTYPPVPANASLSRDVNPYYFIKKLSDIAKNEDIIYIDTGCTIAWMMQGFEVKEGQRLIHDFNNTAMGYALPASIGASFAMGKRQITCLTGDGSLMMNLQELSTITHHQLPIKIILLNNSGHAMIQQTQEQWLQSEYFASSPEGGLALPNFSKVARGFGLPCIEISENNHLEKRLKQVFAEPKSIFCNIHISSKHRVIPQVKYGHPIEDSAPLLPRDIFLKEMLIKPIERLKPTTTNILDYKMKKKS